MIKTTLVYIVSSKISRDTKRIWFFVLFCLVWFGSDGSFFIRSLCFVFVFVFVPGPLYVDQAGLNTEAPKCCD